MRSQDAESAGVAWDLFPELTRFNRSLCGSCCRGDAPAENALKAGLIRGKVYQLRHPMPEPSGVKPKKKEETKIGGQQPGLGVTYIQLPINQKTERDEIDD